MSASCEDVCETIKKRVKEECYLPRHKLVCQVVLGEMKDQGVRVTSRCLWDPDSDNYASAYYKNVRTKPICGGVVCLAYLTISRCVRYRITCGAAQWFLDCTLSKPTTTAQSVVLLCLLRWECMSCVIVTRCDNIIFFVLFTL